jgi:predicted NAD-dependent protein-ADP-ribosyltransferase YbiA (DUF1768 family)
MSYKYEYDAVVLRFGSHTPYYLLTMSFGIFKDPISNHFFTSLDAYMGYNMFLRDEDRQEVLRAPTGYTADLNIKNILKTAIPTEDNPIIIPDWEIKQDDIMLEGLRLKYSQSTCLLSLLRKTKDRPIFDSSRRDDLYWCFADGDGKNMHGKLLERVREELC